MMVLAKCVMS